jgi:hypothetical protein
VALVVWFLLKRRFNCLRGLLYVYQYKQIDQIQAVVKHCCDVLKVDLILTSGGKFTVYYKNTLSFN